MSFQDRKHELDLLTTTELDEELIGIVELGYRGAERGVVGAVEEG